jgi:hypothetical protein
MTTAARSEKGQALVEFIVFLPFMIMLYGIVVIMGNAINGSINQQKVTRGYYFYRLQNNSAITKPFRGEEGGAPIPLTAGWRIYGHFFIGWSDYLEGNSPVAPCYKLTLPLVGSNLTDQCEEPYSQAATQNIRVGTVFGICGVTYFINNNQAIPGPIGPGGNGNAISGVLDPSSCLIQ